MNNYEKKQLKLLEEINILVDKLDSTLSLMKNSNRKYEYLKYKHKLIKEINKILSKEDKFKLNFNKNNKYRSIDIFSDAMKEINRKISIIDKEINFK